MTKRIVLGLVAAMMLTNAPAMAAVGEAKRVETKKEEGKENRGSVESDAKSAERSAERIAGKKTKVEQNKQKFADVYDSMKLSMGESEADTFFQNLSDPTLRNFVAPGLSALRKAKGDKAATERAIKIVKAGMKIADVYNTGSEKMNQEELAVVKSVVERMFSDKASASEDGLKDFDKLSKSGKAVSAMIVLFMRGERSADMSKTQSDKLAQAAMIGVDMILNTKGNLDVVKVSEETLRLAKERNLLKKDVTLEDIVKNCDKKA